MGAFSSLIRHRRILVSTVSEGLRGRFSGNVLGLLWLVLYPLLFLAMYSMVFVQILQVRVPGLATAEYILVVFSGLVPFLAFAEALGTGTGSIVANRDLVLNTLFPVEMVVVRDVLIGHGSMGVGMLLLWLGVMIFHGFEWTHLLVPVVYLMQVFMLVGLVWITSTIAVFFRDLMQAVPIIVLFLMMVSPIAYTSDMVPQAMQPILQFNPLAWLMGIYRSLLIYGKVPVSLLGLFAIFTLLLFVLGSGLIRRLKPLFVDYV